MREIKSLEEALKVTGRPSVPSFSDVPKRLMKVGRLIGIIEIKKSGSLCLK